MFALRGAVSLEQDSSKEMETAIRELFNAFLTQDSLFLERIISIFFSVTKDIKRKNPASALRDIYKEKVSGIALMVFQEAEFYDSPSRIVRVIIHYTGEKLLKPVYLKEARYLRPDYEGKRS